MRNRVQMIHNLATPMAILLPLALLSALAAATISATIAAPPNQPPTDAADPPDRAVTDGRSA